MSIYQISNLRLGNINQDTLNEEINKICSHITEDITHDKYVLFIGKIFDKFHLSINDTIIFKELIQKFSPICKKLLISLECRFPNSPPNVHFVAHGGSLSDGNYNFYFGSHEEKLESGKYNIAIEFIPLAPDEWNAIMMPSIDGDYEINKNIVYGASVMQHNAEETLEKGFIHWQCHPSGIMTPTFIDLLCPRGYVKYLLTEEIIFNAETMDRIDLVAPYFVQVEATPHNQFIKAIQEKHGTIQLVENKEYADFDKESFIEDMLDGEAQEYITAVKERVLKDTIRGTRKQVEILYLSWSNLFCYGEKNHINFTDLKGKVSGMIAGNKSGKSSVVDIIVYVLYNHVLRGDVKNLLNKNSMSGKVLIRLSVDNDIHEVLRNFGKKSSIEYTINNAVIASDITSTYKLLSKIVGGFNDIISSAIMTQDRYCDFILATPMERLKFLGSAMGLDEMDAIIAKIKSEKLYLKSLIRTEYKYVPEAEITELKKKIDLIEEKLPYLNINKEIILIKPSISSSEIMNKIHDIEKRLKAFNIRPLNILETKLKELNANMPDAISSEERTILEEYEPLENTDNILTLYSARANAELDTGRHFDKPLELVPDNELREDKYHEVLNELNVYRERINPEYKRFIKYLKIPQTIIRNVITIRKRIIQLSAKIIQVEPLPMKPMRALRDIDAEIKSASKISSSSISKELQNEIKFNSACVPCRQNKKIITPLYSRTLSHYDELINERALVIEQLEHRRIIEANLLLQNEIKQAEASLLEVSTELDEEITTLEFIYEKYNEIAQNIILEEKINDARKRLAYERRIQYTNHIKAKNIKGAIYRKLSYHISIKRNNYKAHVNKINSIKDEISKHREYEALKRDIKENIELCQRIQAEENEYYGNLQKYDEAMKIREERDKLNTHLEIYKKLLNEKFTEQNEYDKYMENMKKYKINKLCEKCINYKNGLPTQILLRSIHLLTSEINHILMNLCDFHIEFNYDDKSKLYIMVINEYYKVPVEMSSGYQKFIISLAFRHAIIKITERSIPNFIIIDEGFGCLDNSNMEKITHIIPKFKYIYNFVIIISHMDNIANYIEEPIHIEKRNQFSVIRFGAEEARALVYPKRSKKIDDESYRNGTCLLCGTRVSASRWARHILSIKHLNNLSRAP